MDKPGLDHKRGDGLMKGETPLISNKTECRRSTPRKLSNRKEKKMTTKTPSHNREGFKRWLEGYQVVDHIYSSLARDSNFYDKLALTMNGLSYTTELSLEVDRCWKKINDPKALAEDVAFWVGCFPQEWVPEHVGRVIDWPIGEIAGIAEEDLARCREFSVKCGCCVSHESIISFFGKRLGEKVCDEANCYLGIFDLRLPPTDPNLEVWLDPEKLRQALAGEIPWPSDSRESVEATDHRQAQARVPRKDRP